MTMTLEMVAAAILPLTARPSSPLMALLRLSLEQVRPAIPFDLEPSFDKPVMTFSQAERNDDLHDQYDCVRLWHRLVDHLNNLKY